MTMLGGREIAKDYNDIWIHEDDDAARAKLEMWIAKNVGDTLVSAYPGRQWGVNVDISGQMIVITCPSLSTRKGFHIHFKGGTIHELQMRAKDAGGEILERYGMSRGKIFNPDHADALARPFAPDEAVTADSDGINPVIQIDT